MSRLIMLRNYDGTFVLKWPTSIVSGMKHVDSVRALGPL